MYIPSLNVCKEFVRSSLIASSLMKPIFTSGGLQEVKCVYCKVSVGLWWVLMSKMDFPVSRSLLKTIVSRKDFIV